MIWQFQSNNVRKKIHKIFEVEKDGMLSITSDSQAITNKTKYYYEGKLSFDASLIEFDSAIVWIIVKILKILNTETL